MMHATCVARIFRRAGFPVTISAAPTWPRMPWPPCFARRIGPRRTCSAPPLAATGTLAAAAASHRQHFKRFRPLPRCRYIFAARPYGAATLRRARRQTAAATLAAMLGFRCRATKCRSYFGKAAPVARVGLRHCTPGPPRASRRIFNIMRGRWCAAVLPADARRFGASRAGQAKPM